MLFLNRFLQWHLVIVEPVKKYILPLTEEDVDIEEIIESCFLIFKNCKIYYNFFKFKIIPVSEIELINIKNIILSINT